MKLQRCWTWTICMPYQIDHQPDFRLSNILATLHLGNYQREYQMNCLWLGHLQYIVQLRIRSLLEVFVVQSEISKLGPGYITFLYCIINGIIYMRKFCQDDRLETNIRPSRKNFFMMQYLGTHLEVVHVTNDSSKIVWNRHLKRWIDSHY